VRNAERPAGDTLRHSSIVVTIGTMSLYRGIAMVVLGDQAFTHYPEALAAWGQGYFFDLFRVSL